MDKKRQRAPNYNSREKQHLLHLVYKYKNIIENKKTDGTSQQEKEVTWAKIAAEFNSQCPNLVERSVDSLKKFYENQKKNVRKQKANERMEVYRTGGGPPPKQYIDSSDEVIMSILNEKTVHGLENPFDGDAIAVNTDDLSSEEQIFELNLKGTPEDNPDGEVTNSLISESQSNLCSMEPQNTPGKRKIITATRRRPATVVKALTTSAIAEKYSILLDNRTAVSNYEKTKLKNSIEFEREEHELRKEALKLEILLKKQQLNKNTEHM